MDMPILRPIPIPTKGKSFWGKIKAWLFTSRKWMLVEDYLLYVTFLHMELKVPAGFIFDGASIPRLFWNLLIPTGILLIPAIFHDYAYRHHHLLSDSGKVVYKKDRKFFDKMFLEISYQVNGIRTTDKVAWYLLRLFGGKAYGGGGDNA